jgi:hypothetical protein
VNTLEGLKKARALIEAGWTQDTWARDAEGEPVWPESEDAVCFCTRGAVRAATRWNGPERYAMFELLEGEIPSGMIAQWQDSPERTKEEVLDLFDTVIAKVES